MEENAKTILRREVRREVRLRSKVELYAESECVMSLLETLDEFRRASVVALYWSLDDEISTHEFIEKWSAHKTVLLPVVCGEHMTFRRFTSCEQMQRGDFDISEPLWSATEDSADNSSGSTDGDPANTSASSPANTLAGAPVNDSCPIDLIVVPGVAFDGEGHRLGRGRGYYDRFLSNRIIYKVGVCFSHQFFDNVPSQPHDIVMDRVIRPTR